MIAHAGGIDEMAMILMPVVMGVGLWLIMRTGKDETEEDREREEVSGEP